MLNQLDTKRRNQTDLNISFVPHEAQKPFLYHVHRFTMGSNSYQSFLFDLIN